MKRRGQANPNEDFTMKQKKTLRFSDSDSSASALKVPESKRCMTKSHSSDRKEETMNFSAGVVLVFSHVVRATFAMNICAG